MTLLNYLIWNGSPEIFTIGPVFGWGPLVLRWYGLFFALGFYISQQILYYIFSKESKPEKDVDTLTIYMVIATIIGARLGHVFFYEADRYLTHPIDIIKIWEGGLASHGAAIGILTAIWLYARKRKPGQSFLQTIDRIVILVAITGALIRVGNFFNSEIIGKPTDKPWGVVFVNKLTNSVTSKKADTNKIVDFIKYRKDDKTEDNNSTLKPLHIEVYFNKNVTQDQADNYMRFTFENALKHNNEFFLYKNFDPQFIKLSDGTVAAHLMVSGISRHPAQIYEALSCILLALVLYLIWNKHKSKLPPGRLFGIFLIVCFGLRFLYEYLKEPQVNFENDMSFYMGQILSVPLVIAGIIILFLSFTKKEVGEAQTE